MAIVTALRARPRGRIAVDLDGSHWRVLPGEAVVQAGLAVGAPVNREAARTVRRVLRRSEGLDVAVRTLRARDASREELGQRLTRAAVAPAIRAEVVETLERSGIVDDGRYARARAAALAARGYGDAAIDADLEARGVPHDLRAGALAELQAESERAEAVIERRGRGPKTARFLARKGFGEDAVIAAAGRDFAPDP